MSGYRYTEEAEDLRDGPYTPPIDAAAILREQVPGNPDPRPGPTPAHVDMPYDH